MELKSPKEKTFPNKFMCRSSLLFHIMYPPSIFLDQFIHFFVRYSIPLGDLYKGGGMVLFPSVLPSLLSQFFFVLSPCFFLLLSLSISVLLLFFPKSMCLLLHFQIFAQFLWWFALLLDLQFRAWILQAIYILLCFPSCVGKLPLTFLCMVITRPWMASTIHLAITPLRQCNCFWSFIGRVSFQFFWFLRS